MLSVNAEEDPGKIYNDSINIEEWRFDVEVNIVERTGITLGERVQMMTSTERKALHTLNSLFLNGKFQPYRFPLTKALP